MQTQKLNTNDFKRAVKQWIAESPSASIDELVDFCEDLIPPQQHQSYMWLVDQTTQWYKHVLAQREQAKNYSEEDDID